MLTKAQYLEKVVPYRMKAIEVFRAALACVLAWERPKRMDMYFDGELLAGGPSTAWTNPVIESGVVHCRACLEFLGLRESRAAGKLGVRTGKRSDDYGVEDFGLPLVEPQAAVSAYEGAAEEAELALASVIRCANKGIAHMTSHYLVGPEDLRLYAIAAKGVPVLMANHLYVPLGLPVPRYTFTASPHGTPA